MKHVKAYEDIHDELELQSKLIQVEKEIKKYVLFKMIDVVVILKVMCVFYNDESSNRTPKDEIMVKLRRLYIQSEYGLSESEQDVYDFVWDVAKDSIPYQTDDLQDAVDMAPAILDSNKYNL